LVYFGSVFFSYIIYDGFSNNLVMMVLV